jgi:hypothetical protein
MMDSVSWLNPAKNCLNHCGWGNSKRKRNISCYVLEVDGRSCNISCYVLEADGRSCNISCYVQMVVKS